MIEATFKAYAALSILAPWLFFLARLANFINYPGRNSLIFAGLFIYSSAWLVFLFWTYKK